MVSHFPSPTVSSPFFISIRNKHSSRQIKRLFKNNPARRRIQIKNSRNNNNNNQEIDYDLNRNNIPKPQFAPILDPPPPSLPNGWNPPPSDDIQLPEYPFRVSRTKNKPNDAVGFLPVYSEFRKDGARTTTRIKKVSGDQDIFMNELRAALQIPIPNNPKEDTVRIRTGGTIEVKGNRVQEVKQWLAGLGF
ncbi:mitochondrial large subunit ribosomal protein Img2 [Nitzschia inconspicua]|uniref:Large ribosomal subunit protein mL49 n=1 Tax=Nitzschia inconspicua TaxID=303405 RepID=A0A9K3L6R2_9STRA|nr:mitochondrial large subunit ribosomal protein Img2 [Nitzschia inconspicua]